jgi:LysR family transcriptional regulator, regulator for metE and metH
VQSYIERNYVTARPIGSEGLIGQLFIACNATTSVCPWLSDFVQITRESSFLNLREIELL